MRLTHVLVGCGLVRFLASASTPHQSQIGSIRPLRPCAHRTLAAACDDPSLLRPLFRRCRREWAPSPVSSCCGQAALCCFCWRSGHLHCLVQVTPWQTCTRSLDPGGSVLSTVGHSLQSHDCNAIAERTMTHKRHLSRPQRLCADERTVTAHL